MIDLHSHILPGIDDGAANLKEALAMAHLAVQSGVRAMTVTPHCVDGSARDVYHAWLYLRDALEEHEIPLKLYPGMEIFGTEYTARLLQDGRLFTLNGSNYPLIEFSFQSTGQEATRILDSVLRAGYRPLIAHPERYAAVQSDPRLLNEWLRMGCLFQINRGSLLGRFGSTAQEMAFAMVGRGFATVVASDAHSPRMRTPWMQDVQELLTEEFSPAAAQYLLLHNPGRILKNEPLPPVEPEWF